MPRRRATGCPSQRPRAIALAMSTPYHRIAIGPTCSAIAPGEWNIEGLYGAGSGLSIIQRLFRRFAGEFVDTLKNRPVSSRGAILLVVVHHPPDKELRAPRSGSVNGRDTELGFRR